MYRSSAGTSPNEGYLASSYGSAPQSLPTFHHPSHALLKENGFTQQVYHKYHSRCLKGKYEFSFFFSYDRLYTELFKNYRSQLKRINLTNKGIDIIDNRF